MIDLLVAGGGPAGLVTALHAARAGMRTVVVEPRTGAVDKACGEGLMPGAVRALAALGVAPPGYRFTGIRYTDGVRVAQAPFRAGAGLGVRRTALHAALHGSAVGAGVEFVARRVVEVEQDERCVRAAGLRARHLVAADGLHSRVRRELGLDRPARGARRWGTRAHFAVTPWSDHVEVHWAPDAEAYVTPVAADCVGVAVLTDRQLPYGELLARFPLLAERLPQAPLGPVRGAGPLRQRAARRVAGRVLLVGDAAGYVDALTGEGLAMAFGCAQALVRRLVDGTPAGYERDYLRLTRSYRLLTSALVWGAARPALRRRIVPLARSAPALFRAAVDQVAA